MPKTVKKELLKLKKIIHPRSRKTKQLTKLLHKSANRQKSKLVHYVKQNLVGEKLLWFRDNHDPERTTYTPELTAQLIEKYLARFDDEREQIRLKHSVGNRNRHRQHASREDIIRLTVLREEEEFATCGLEVPDLLNVQQLEVLKNWSGELKFLQNFKLQRYSRSDLEEFSRKHMPVTTQAMCDVKQITNMETKTDVEMLTNQNNTDKGETGK